MKFDDFAANRTYVFGSGANSGSDGDVGTGTKRFLYTQATEGATGLAPTAIPFVGGSVSTPTSTLDFSLVNTEATATATITGGDAVRTVPVAGQGNFLFTGVDNAGTTITGTTLNAYLGDNVQWFFLLLQL